ncbi:MAG TPA: glycoside hydrolase family 2 TIM barrel-domain containing protein, partial [Bacteroidales bacterium]|nr:glycoside hydrolase family 2 TIM barrel-domain containing protein [Bacteroidales bacterium]
MRNLLFIFSIIFFSVCSHLQSQTAIHNINSRNIFSLNGKWNYIVDPYETGYYEYRYVPFDQNPNPWGGFFLDQRQKNKSELIEYSFDKSPAMQVPGDWNSQDEKLFYYEGTVWFRKVFDYRKSSPDNRVYVYFGAVNYESDVYLNGKKLGKHIGGFTPFNYEITALLRDEENFLVVKVDNKRKPEGVPTLNTDWWNYGGITRDVTIVEVPGTFILDYAIQLKKGSKQEIAGFVKLDGETINQKVHVEIPELKISKEFTCDGNGYAEIHMMSDEIGLWSPTNPKLYQVNIIGQTDKVSERIGFRSIETSGTEILLNGKPVFLRGICIHEENPLRGGRANSQEDARLLLNWAKELNCNYVRLAHYPHNEHMARLADEMGIMVWEEIPVYWTIMFDNPETFDNAKQQLTDLIHRDKNRASVIIWSMANETPVSEERIGFLKGLVMHAQSMDDTRLISAAMEAHRDRDDPNIRIVEDPFADFVDVVSFNEYVGWYDGLPEKCDSITWKIPCNKPVIISECGGGALQGLHGDPLTRWSEEFQEDLYQRTLEMLAKIPQFRGISPWILCDFRSPRRLLPGIQDGWNRKGVVGQNGQKK